MNQPTRSLQLKPQRARAYRSPVLASAVQLLAGLLLAISGGVIHADTKVRISSFAYQANGLLSQEIVEPTSPASCLQTSYTYDIFGNKSTVSSTYCAGATGDTIASAASPRTAGTTSAYSPDGLTLTVVSTNALGQSETKIIDRKFGTMTRLTGPNGLSTNWEYDSFGRKTREIRADGTTTTWGYKLCTEANTNCPASIDSAPIVSLAIEQSYAVNGAINAPQKIQYFDVLNRALRSQTQGFDGGASASLVLVQDIEYNTLGQSSRQSNSYALVGGTPVWTTFTYDQMGRVLTESRPDTTVAGGTATTTYSYNGLSSSVTNPAGKTQTTLKNAQGKVALVTDPLGNTVSYSYDALGNLIQTNAAGSITTISYNQRGQKIAMNDPAMGEWTYAYNAFGELVSQRDSLNQTSTMAYDALGRMVSRTEPDLVSSWSYDKNFAGVACGKSVGKLCEAKTTNGYNRKHNYDVLGRPDSIATVLDNPGVPAAVTETFDSNTGRITSKTWPTGYKATYAYSPLGYLKTVTGSDMAATPKIVSYQILAMNSQGQVTQYKTGNNVTTVNTFANDTGRLMGQSATLAGQADGNVLKQAYTYDALGNLLTRNDTSPGVGTQENFVYDSLNRLSKATIIGGVVSPASVTEVLYDARGNIVYKSDVGRYWYDAQRPNRMSAVTLESYPGATVALSGTRALSYAFDDTRTNAQTMGGIKIGNGNLEYTVSRDVVNGIHTVRYETYTSFNMPSTLVTGNFASATYAADGKTLVSGATNTVADRTLTYVYGPEHQRVKQNVALGSVGTSAYFAGNTWYLNGIDSLGLTYEKEVRANGTVENKHYVSAAGVNFAVFVSRSGNLNGLPASTTSYFHQDQLGSISAITNEAGVVTERLAYDPWGKRRFINSTPGLRDATDTIVGINTERGFTGHEHLDEIGVIHMNGRIYDPLMGRFMSADPMIEAPYELASYNRYSYVWNNPLNRTDLNGFCWICNPLGETAQFAQQWNEKQIYATGTAINKLLEPLPPAVRGMAIAAGAVLVCGPNAPGCAAAVTGTAVASSAYASGASPTDAVRAGLIAAGTSYAFYEAGNIYKVNPTHGYYAHAAIGCVSSVANGNNCAAGATAAVFGKYATVTSDDMYEPYKFAVTVVAGGVGSVIAGGKFENGATTAAYGYLYNHFYSKFKKPDQLCGPEMCGGGVGGGSLGGGAAKSEVTVYRAFGGDARAQGFSWTTKDPRTVGNFRDAAGLPSGGPSGATNTADFLVKGQANALDVIKSRSALPLDGNKGGLPELIIDPKNVRITDFSVLKP